MYQATGQKTGKVYMTGQDKPEVMRKLITKFGWITGGNGISGNIYPEPLVIAADVVDNRVEPKNEKEVNRELIRRAELGDQEAIRTIKNKFIDKREKRKDPRSIKIKITKESGEVIIASNMAEAARKVGVSPTVVKRHSEFGTIDTRGNKYERVGSNE